ncbi:MAG: hypothetical protein ACTH7R_10625 [Corynebacterium flavescens]|uniref:hypothetical protein n=1 Tax=Corynebacterium flavescens TaxID=28028 RepID=UPI003F908804
MEKAPNVQQQVAALFRQQAEREGISHAQLADMISSTGYRTSASSITKMLNGDRGISLDMAMRLCYILNVDWDDVYIKPADEAPGITRQLEGMIRWLRNINLGLEKVMKEITLVQQYNHFTLAMSGAPLEWFPPGDVDYAENMKARIEEANKGAKRVELEKDDLDALKGLNALLHELSVDALRMSKEVRTALSVTESIKGPGKDVSR